MMKTVVALVGAFAAVVVGFAPAAFANQEQQPEASQGQVTLPIEDVQRFARAIGLVKRFYVEPVDDKKLFSSAIRGMLSGQDPHSAFLDMHEFTELKQSTQGEFGGLGIEVGMEDGYVKVISPIDDTPAHKAGLQAGDLIVKLDDKPIKGMTLNEAVRNMRGKKGSPARLTIFRKKTKKVFVVSVVREVIQIQSVKSKILDDHYGYIRISRFQAPTGKEMHKAVKALNKEAGGKMRGLVLDLRNNPGGLLDSAVEISEAFLDHKKATKHSGKIVYTEGRLPGSKFEAKLQNGDVLKGAPIVVLINEGSASASEIVAGALQDHGRALLVGTQTFGKGSVQTVLPLDEQHALKLTTARYYTPKGRAIQAVGIKPDIEVKALKIEVPKDESEELALMIREADLNGHLGSEDEKSGDKAAGAEKKDLPLIYRDYQLHEGLNLLKGLALVKVHAA